MDWKQLIPIGIAVLTTIGGGVSATGWSSSHQSFERAADKYRAAKELGRACMGEAAFDLEWRQVLADLREAEGQNDE